MLASIVFFLLKEAVHDSDSEDLLRDSGIIQLSSKRMNINVNVFPPFFSKSFQKRTVVVTERDSGSGAVSGVWFLHNARNMDYGHAVMHHARY